MDELDQFCVTNLIGDLEYSPLVPEAGSSSDGNGVVLEDRRAGRWICGLYSGFVAC